MPHLGGPTTQSGILFQNSVASLFLGDLLDTAASGSQQVVAVRVEAPALVDDTVVSYADSHLVYIQAKESLRVAFSRAGARGTDEESEDDLEEQEAQAPRAGAARSPRKTPWEKLWLDFEAQFLSAGFGRGRDRLMLFCGSLSESVRDLKALCEWAKSSKSTDEWRRELPKKQKSLIEDKIRPLLKPERRAWPELRELLGHVDVEVWPLNFIERYMAPRRMPPCSQAPEVLFDLLVTKAGRNARERQEFQAQPLRDYLASEPYKIEFKASPSLQQVLEAVSNCNSVLQNQRVTIGQHGPHVERAVAVDIVSQLCCGWLTANDADEDENATAIQNQDEDAAQEMLALLHETAGLGKTVVMHEVLAELQRRHVPTLAIKADIQLRSLSVHNSISQCLELPDSVERVAQRLAGLRPDCGAVILIDQVDALSLSLARDQQALDKVLDLVLHLRAIPNVRVLLSCRTFDLNTDPALKRLPRQVEFALARFSPEEVEAALQAIGVASASLGDRVGGCTIPPRRPGLEAWLPLPGRGWGRLVQFPAPASTCEPAGIGRRGRRGGCRAVSAGDAEPARTPGRCRAIHGAVPRPQAQVEPVAGPVAFSG